MNTPAPAPAPSRLLLRRLAPPLAVGVAFTVAVATGWRRWGHLAIDTGRELELPRRLLAGDRLYTDLRYYYGPLAPNVNAGLYALFGVHADVLMWAGIVSAAVATWLVYLLARAVTSRLGATVAAVAFVFVCAFQRVHAIPSIFTFALPYTFAATYGIVAAMASLLFLVRHARTGRTASLLLSIGLLMVTGLSKLEPFLPILAAHALFVGTQLLSRSLRRGTLPAYAAAAALLAGIWGWIRWSVGAGLWAENLAGVVNEASLRFILDVMGLLDPVGSLGKVALSGLALTASVGAILGTIRLLDSATPRPAAVRRLVSIGLPLALFLVFGGLGPNLAFPILPWIVAVSAAASLRQWHQTRATEPLVAALLGVFAFLALLRILYRPLPDHYGFYLLPVALVVGARLLFSALPGRASTLTGRRVAIVAALAISLGTTTFSAVRSTRDYARCVVPVETARGSVRVPPQQAWLPEVIGALQRHPPGTRVLALPQGIAIVFFAGQEGADGMFSYLPMEIPDEEADLRLAARWRRRPPDLVLDIAYDLLEFGSAGFGVDYAQASAAFLARTYVLETSFPSGLRLYRRAPPTPASPDATESPASPAR